MAARSLVEMRPEHIDALCEGVPADLWKQSKYAGGGVFRTFFIDGEPVGLLGVLPVMRRVATSAAFFSQRVGRYDMLWVTRMSRHILDGLQPEPYRRIEGTVRQDFGPGHRWMRLLGFEAEGAMRKREPDGADSVLYARIRE